MYMIVNGDSRLGIRKHQTPYTIFNFAKNRITDVKSQVIERSCSAEEWQNIWINESLATHLTGEN